MNRLLARTLAVAGQGAVIGLITMLLLEAIVAVSLWRPRLALLPRPLLQYLYTNVDRDTIQVMPACARYDPQVTYTLRPGGCTFANREFSNRYQVNNLGLRDDDASLHGPETVVIGDSLAMGWGVEQDEAFPQVFERLTGSRTLNAGVSSYGTVRELRMLERIDRSGLRTLVVQYTDNDFSENRQFVTTGSLRILSEADYERTVRDNARTVRYLPGKYALNLLAQWRATVRQVAGGAAATDGDSAGNWDRHAQLFLDVLERSPVPLQPYRIAVVTLQDGFAAALRQRVSAAAIPWVGRVHVLDLSSLHQQRDAFFVLDDHPTRVGQAAIAAALATWFRSAE